MGVVGCLSRVGVSVKGRILSPGSLSQVSGGSRIFQMGGRCFVTNGGAHILFSGKKCMKLKEIGLKWGGRTSFSALL